MNARDELADALKAIEARKTSFNHFLSYHREVAEELIAAGYSKPRTVTTAEELDALGQDAVVRDADGVVYDRDRIVTFPHPLRWHPAGVAADVGSTLIALPATVLFTPKES